VVDISIDDKLLMRGLHSRPKSQDAERRDEDTRISKRWSFGIHKEVHAFHYSSTCVRYVSTFLFRSLKLNSVKNKFPLIIYNLSWHYVAPTVLIK
jgi:hypothetical protein